MTRLIETAVDALQTIRETAPLVHNITNYVVMNFTANALLSLGASPVMAHAVEEVEEMTAFAGALVINIGTLSTPSLDSMLVAGKAAKVRGVPIVLDPVGAGATKMRSEAARRILFEVGPDLIRGNGSEILSIAQEDGRTKGVDSTADSTDALAAAARLAGVTGAVVAVTGEVDLVTDGKRTFKIANGHPLMGRVTGTGCAASAITGAFLAAEEDKALAAASALIVYGIAGELAAKQASRPGSYKTALIDALDAVDDAAVGKMAKATEFAADGSAVE